MQVCQKFKVFQSLSFNRCFLVGDLSMTETRSLSYTFIYTEFFKKFQVFPKVKFVQSLSFSKVNFFPKFKFVQSSGLSKVQVCPKFRIVQSSGFSKVQVCPKFFKFQNNGFLKMFKSISMALRPGLHLVQEGLAKEECPKEHFKKSIIQISMFSFHQSSSFSSKFKFFIRVQVFHQSSKSSQNVGFKYWFQMLISKNVIFTKYWFQGLIFQNVGLTVEMFPCWWLVNDWVWFTDLQFYLYLSKFKIFIKVHKSFNVQFSS